MQPTSCLLASLLPLPGAQVFCWQKILCMRIGVLGSYCCVPQTYVCLGAELNWHLWEWMNGTEDSPKPPIPWPVFVLIPPFNRTSFISGSSGITNRAHLIVDIAFPPQTLPVLSHHWRVGRGCSSLWCVHVNTNQVSWGSHARNSTR